MKALTLNDFDSGPVLGEQPRPEIGPTDVLVRVEAASVNAMDGMVAGGLLKGALEHDFPVTIGRDLAGVVEAVGSDVTRFAEGGEVLGFIGALMPLHDGAIGEYAKVPEATLAHKPAGLGYVQAAALALAGVTAQLAVDAVAPRPGDVVLIVGATGGVGSFAIQQAARTGASVAATALPGDEAYVRELGAAETFDYSADLGAAVRAAHPDGIDGLIDLVNQAEGFAALAKLLRRGGRAATTLSAADPDNPPTPGVQVANVMSAEADPSVLERLAELAAAGELAVPVQDVYPLDEAQTALGRLSNGHLRGKVAISVASQEPAPGTAAA